jgi:hypothetical protein
MISARLFGIPFWSRHVADLLNKHTDDIRASFVPPSAYASLLLRPPRDGSHILVRMGFRPAARTARGRAFELYWRALVLRSTNPMAAHYWLGTDVLHATRDAARWPASREALARTADDLHLACAPWLADELRDLGIHAEVAVIPEANGPPERVAPMPADLTVLTYLPAGRFDFYGGSTIMAAAAELPDVRFRVVGCSPDDIPDAPANVRCLGWVDDMTRMYAESSVVVRLTEHDGFGGTVVEALLHGRYAVYTHEVPHMLHVDRTSVQDLVRILGDLRDRQDAGQLGPNVAGRAYAMKEFEEQRLMSHLISLLRTHALSHAASPGR